MGVSLLRTQRVVWVLLFIGGSLGWPSFCLAHTKVVHLSASPPFRSGKTYKLIVKYLKVRGFRLVTQSNAKTLKLIFGTKGRLLIQQGPRQRAFQVPARLQQSRARARTCLLYLDMFLYAGKVTPTPGGGRSTPHPTTNDDPFALPPKRPPKKPKRRRRPSPKPLIQPPKRPLKPTLARKKPPRQRPASVKEKALITNKSKGRPKTGHHESSGKPKERPKTGYQESSKKRKAAKAPQRQRRLVPATPRKSALAKQVAPIKPPRRSLLSPVEFSLGVAPEMMWKGEGYTPIGGAVFFRISAWGWAFGMDLSFHPYTLPSTRMIHLLRPRFWLSYSPPFGLAIAGRPLHLALLAGASTEHFLLSRTGDEYTGRFAWGAFAGLQAEQSLLPWLWIFMRGSFAYFSPANFSAQELTSESLDLLKASFALGLYVKI